MTWLYTGAEGPPLAAQSAAVADYVSNRGRGPEGRRLHAAREAVLRTRLAELVGLPDVALVSNASEAINIVAASLDLRPGDSVVLNDLEYPSVVHPWLNMRARGVDVRVARSSAWQLPSEAISELVDSSTRAIAISHVSYLSGWRHDLAEVSRIASDAGAFLLVDATQSLGVIPVQGALADAVVSSSYKWLLGGHGIGVLAWNTDRRELPAPASVGWRSMSDIFTPDRFDSFDLNDDARRFEVGYPSYPSIYSLLASVEWLSGFDAAAVEAHVAHVTERLIEGLRHRDLDVMTPTDPGRRAGNVAFRATRGEQISELLADRGIMTWGGDGRLRASIHLFNADEDVDRLLAAMDDPGVLPLLERR